MVKVQSLSKRYRGVQAVVDLSFDIAPGEVLGLLGPNGAGKTTTLRMLSGVLRPDSGSIEIGGLEFSSNAIEVKKQSAYLPDEPVFFDHLTCWEHVRFIAGVYSMDEFEPRAESLFSRLELDGKKNAFPSELSKGLRQRLGLICSILHSPKLLLLDEPMIGLDPRGIRTLNEIILECAKGGCAVILSSHLLPMLEEVCTKVLVLNQGKATLFGAIGELRRPREGGPNDRSLEEMFFSATEKDDVA